MLLSPMQNDRFSIPKPGDYFDVQKPRLIDTIFVAMVEFIFDGFELIERVTGLFKM